MSFALVFVFGFILKIGGRIGDCCGFSLVVFILVGDLGFSVDNFKAAVCMGVVGSFCLIITESSFS